MNVSVNMSEGAVTQKADVMDMVSHLSWLMLYSGIKELSVRSFSAGMAHRVIADMEPYEEAPESVRIRGVVVKEDVGHIMASMGIMSINIKSVDKQELKILKSRWKKMDEALISAGGSFQA